MYDPSLLLTRDLTDEYRPILRKYLLGQLISEMGPW
jgi:hypothetical protein